MGRIRIDDPTTLLGRAKVARSCTAGLNLSIPTVVDDMQDTVNQLYKAWPERIYVIGRDRKIAYKSGIGPWGFRPKEAERALAKALEAGKPGKGL